MPNVATWLLAVLTTVVIGQQPFTLDTSTTMVKGKRIYMAFQIRVLRCQTQHPLTNLTNITMHWILLNSFHLRICRDGHKQLSKLLH